MTKSSRSPSGCIARRSKRFPTSPLKICNAAAPLPTALPSRCGSGCAPWWSTKSIIAARFIFTFRCSKRRLHRFTDSLPSKSGSAAFGASESSPAVCRQFMAASGHRGQAAQLCAQEQVELAREGARRATQRHPQNCARTRHADDRDGVGAGLLGSVALTRFLETMLLDVKRTVLLVAHSITGRPLPYRGVRNL